MTDAPHFQRARHINESTPLHYRGHTGLQPIDVIDDWALGFHVGNIVKYVCRADRKGGVADLKKARHYAELARRSINLASYPHRGLTLSVSQVVAEFEIPDSLVGVIEAINTIAVSPGWAREQLPRIEAYLANEIRRLDEPAVARQVMAAEAADARRLIEAVCA